MRRSRRPTPQPPPASPSRRRASARILFELREQRLAQFPHPRDICDLSAIAIDYVEHVQRLVGFGRDSRKMNREAELEKSVRDREQQSDPVLGAYVHHREL